MDRLTLLQRHALKCALGWTDLGDTVDVYELLRRFFLVNYNYLPHPDYIAEISNEFAKIAR